MRSSFWRRARRRASSPLSMGRRGIPRGLGRVQGRCWGTAVRSADAEKGEEASAAADGGPEAASSGRELVPYTHTLPILRELAFAPHVGGGELARVVRAVARRFTSREREELEPLERAVRGELGVEREELAVARARGVGLAAIVRAEQRAGAVALREHHQPPPGAELHEG